MKKPKIKILKKSKISKIERDIIVAGAPDRTEEVKEMLKKAVAEKWTFEFDPEVMNQLKELGLTPEQLIQKSTEDEKDTTDTQRKEG